ncbi:alanine racemase [Alkalicoccobacillus gibsonii]|uniref:alanine racemase n=1 Tax=Alkalicoccobacillus gibsonii TaxID=79881 RepID=UPI003519D263
MSQSRAWMEVNLDYLQHNVERIRSTIPKKTNIMAVVKADAYGHGLEQTAFSLFEAGVTNFAVATLDEAVQLRNLLPSTDILILGMTSPKEALTLSRLRLIQSVFSPTYTKALAIAAGKAGVNIQVEIKIDTGMNRMGYAYLDTIHLKEIFSYTYLHVHGIYSHLSVADSLDPIDVEMTNVQVSRFNQCLGQLKDYPYGKTHLQNSGGIINHSHLTYDFVRPGIMLFGIPSGEVKEIGLKPVLELKARISMIKTVPMNEWIGYGRTCKFATPRKIATVSIGYADGYPRAVSGKRAPILINGHFAKQVGNVCMDQLMIDITDIDGIKSGDQVVLIGTSHDKAISMGTIAALAQTITNDLACSLSLRVSRYYHSTSSKKDVEPVV